MFAYVNLSNEDVICQLVRPTIWMDNRNHKPISLNREIGQNSIQMFLTKMEEMWNLNFHPKESFVGIIGEVQRFCAT